MKRVQQVASKPQNYHFGAVEKGKLKLSDRPRFQCALNALDGDEVRLTVERKPAQRKSSTSNQRRYYWAVICSGIGNFIGCTAEETHDSLKAKFLCDHIERDGYKFDVVRSTEKLSTLEREEYHTKIREWASIELGYYVPLPNEVSF